MKNLPSARSALSIANIKRMEKMKPLELNKWLCERLTHYWDGRATFTATETGIKSNLVNGAA